VWSRARERGEIDNLLILGDLYERCSNLGSPDEMNPAKASEIDHVKLCLWRKRW